MSGLTPTGFTPETADTITTAIEADEKTSIDPAVDVDDPKGLAPLNASMAAKVAAVEQMVADIYNAMDPDTATGDAADISAALTGTTRKGTTSTVVACTVNLDQGHVFAIATLDRNGNVITPGDLIANIAGHPEFVFTATGLVPAVGNPVVRGPIDTTGASTPGAYAVFFECLTPGPIACLAGTLTTITSPKAGFNSVSNSVDGELGALVETDSQLNARRVAELVPVGGGTLASLRATLLKVPGSGPGGQGPIDAVVLCNDLLTTDPVSGLPPHSICAIIWDGTVPQTRNDDIAQALWNASAGGIQKWDALSGISGNAIDSNGVTHAVGFARATLLNFYIAISISVDSTYPATGDAQLAAALASFGNAYAMGAEIVALALKSVGLGNSKGYARITGLIDVPSFAFDTASTPVNTANWHLTKLQKAAFSTSRITITHV